MLAARHDDDEDDDDEQDKKIISFPYEPLEKTGMLYLYLKKKRLNRKIVKIYSNEECCFSL